MLRKVINWFQSLSFKTGLVVLGLCVPCYLFSFLLWTFPISLATKGSLWVASFGLAKTFQYAGLAILGVEGIKRLKKWWNRTFRRTQSIEVDD